MPLADPTTTASTAAQDGVKLADVEKTFHYVLAVPFPFNAVPIAVKALYGSTCNDICRVTVQTAKKKTADGAPAEEKDYFLKSSRGVKQAEILLEAGGLALLRAAGLPVPPVLLAGVVEGTAFLVEPFIETGGGGRNGLRRQCSRDEAAAGRALAQLHRCRSPDGRFGCRPVVASLNSGEVEVPSALSLALSEAAAALTATTPSSSFDACIKTAGEAYTSTFIWSGRWPDLYLTSLLQPQVTRVQQRGLWSADRQKMFNVFAERFRAHFAARAFVAAEEKEGQNEGGTATKHPSAQLNSHTTEELQKKDQMKSNEGDESTAQETALPSVPDCSLLHGDMWGGNLMFDVAGSPLFIDPQPLYGDREMDVAMTHFFGGFGPKFYAAYEEEYPLEEEAEMRMPWYQLYYALMHLSLFGEAYGRAVEEAMQSV